jgi:hypothetical protein
VTFNVALSKTPAPFEGVGVNVTLNEHDPGAEIVPEHVFVCTKSFAPVAALFGVMPILVTVRVFPVPLTLKFTACGALPVLPVGTPNERLPGDTVTL